ncbi:hypothetical protein DJ013_01790 [Arcticibacterium luteifluviistationis]|uniref:Uncharacterized protein n=1 Tax=Arcticibacterium luteifluviistationis TaxID=1784714 RepID=A0A2Z4G752_9BACT|nr:hypothetical protein DJ013_01790 [Arcticibacterium luteifluviistationis]
MRTWLAILLFAGLTFLSLGIRPYVSDRFIGLILGNVHYIYLIILFCFSQSKETTFLKGLFFLLIVAHFALDLFVFFELRMLDDTFIISINLIFITTFYLCFLIQFKRLGSGFYTKRKADWYIGFPTGLATFLILLFFFHGRVQPKFDGLLILLGMFISFFYIIGVNTNLKTKNYVILLLGLILNFAALIIAIYVLQVESFKGGEVLMKGLFMLGYYCLLEAVYQISDPIISPRSLD